MEESKGRPYLRYILSAAVLIGLVVAAVRYVNGEEVLRALETFNYAYVPFMLAASTLYLGLKAWRFVLLICPIVNVRQGVAFRAYVAGQAMTLLPGGVAGRAGLMKQAGVELSESGAPVAFSSILDQLVFILGALVAALWFEAARAPALILLGVLVALAFVFLIPATRGWLNRAAEWIARRFNFVEQWREFLDTIPQIMTLRVMASTIAITLVAFALKIVVLDLSLRGVGLPLPYPTLFLAYIVPTVFGRIFPLPAGVGVTEAGMVGFLASTSQVDVETVTAAVAIFRIATVLYEAALGALVYFFAWRGEDEVATAQTSYEVQ